VTTKLGMKENILEFIKEHDGLTYEKILKYYKEKYPDKPTKKSGYKYL